MGVKAGLESVVRWVGRGLLYSCSSAVVEVLEDEAAEGLPLAANRLLACSSGTKQSINTRNSSLAISKWHEVLPRQAEMAIFLVRHNASERVNERPTSRIYGRVVESSYLAAGCTTDASNSNTKPPISIPYALAGK